MSNYQTSRTPNDILTISSAIEFVLTKRFLDVQTMTIGKVLAVNEAQKTLTVQSLINYKLADGTGENPPVLYDVPYGVIQGGKAAIIIHYAVNDIVLIGFVYRSIDELKGQIADIKTRTNFVNTKLLRNHSIMDAFVIMNWGKGNTPTTYIDLSDSNGINIQSDQTINIVGSTVNLGANTGTNGIVVSNGNPQVTITTGSSAGTYPVENITISSKVKAV